MRSLILRAPFVAAWLALGVVTPGCKADIHDNTVNTNANLDFKVDANVDVDHVAPGSSVAVNMNVSGAVLVDPNTTPKPDQVDTAVFLKVFLDDEDSDPILVTAQAHASVTIPATTPPGDHKLICRVHKHDGTPTDQEQEISIKVTASASVSVGQHDAG